MLAIANKYVIFLGKYLKVVGIGNILTIFLKLTFYFYVFKLLQTHYQLMSATIFKKYNVNFTFLPSCACDHIKV